MYISISKSTSKKGKRWQWTKGKSPALKNPYILPAISQSFSPASLKGEVIEREPRPSYNIKVGASKRVDGKARSTQKHLYSFSEWDIIDSFMEAKEMRWEAHDGGCIDYDWYVKQLKKGFPAADADIVWEMMLIKIRPIEQRIVADFQQSEEFKWWCRTLELKQELKAEHKKQRAGQEEKQQQQRQEQHGKPMSHPAPLSLSMAQAKVIEKCYKAMAVQIHPDKGGTGDDMAQLNSLMDRIKAVR